MSQPCKPVHQWALPKVGDTCLGCEVCGRRIDFLIDLTPTLRASIVNGRRNHFGEDDADRFRHALYEAIEADQKSGRQDRIMEQKRAANPFRESLAHDNEEAKRGISASFKMSAAERIARRAQLTTGKGVK